MFTKFCYQLNSPSAQQDKRFQTLDKLGRRNQINNFYSFCALCWYGKEKLDFNVVSLLIIDSFRSWESVGYHTMKNWAFTLSPLGISMEAWIFMSFMEIKLILFCTQTRCVMYCWFIRSFFSGCAKLRCELNGISQGLKIWNVKILNAY